LASGFAIANWQHKYSIYDEMAVMTASDIASLPPRPLTDTF